jgi:hypothetical protein
MYDVIILITALVIIFLGIRLTMKFREMSSWKDDDAIVGGIGSSSLPTELRELKIEEPSEDTINRLDTSEENRIPGDNTPPKQT